MGQCSQVSKQRKSGPVSMTGQGLLAPSPVSVSASTLLPSEGKGRGGERDKAEPAALESSRATVGSGAARVAFYALFSEQACAPVGLLLLFLLPDRYKSQQEKLGKCPHLSFRHSVIIEIRFLSVPLFSLLLPLPAFLRIYSISGRLRLRTKLRTISNSILISGKGCVYVCVITIQPVKVPNQTAGERGFVDKRKQWKSR